MLGDTASTQITWKISYICENYAQRGDPCFFNWLHLFEIFNDKHCAYSSSTKINFDFEKTFDNVSNEIVFLSILYMKTHLQFQNSSTNHFTSTIANI